MKKESSGFLLTLLLSSCFILCYSNKVVLNSNNEGFEVEIIKSKNDESDSSHFEKLAALELRRYIYLVTNNLARLSQYDGTNRLDRSKHLFIISTVDLLMKNYNDVIKGMKQFELPELNSKQSEHVIFSTMKDHQQNQITFLVGADPLSALYAVYSYCERFLKIRFTMQSDILPHVSNPNRQVYYSPPHANPDEMIHFTASFAIRGIQPFHDFPEGPDWWSADDYKAIYTQISKMKLNFVGLHTYPLNEPSVWVGTPSQVNIDGTVQTSYPTSWMSSLQGTWGYNAMNTSDYYLGSKGMFDSNCSTGNSNVNAGDDYCPLPATMKASNEVFHRAGRLLNDTFTWASKYCGIQTCVGTEIPLTKPNASISTQEYYEGMFKRISLTHQLDYYWLWTPEGWEWSGINSSNPVVPAAVDDINTAYKVLSSLPNLPGVGPNVNFSLVLSGWVLGPLPDRTFFDTRIPAGVVAMSSLDQQVGWSPVDPAYAKVTIHKKWAIPWLEDDPGLAALEIWVNRTMEHALAAKQYGCDGLLGIHWRTLEVSPALEAMSLVAWSQLDNLTSLQFWNEWSTAQFGIPGAGVILQSIDSFNDPRPVSWTTGPGGMLPSVVPWSHFQPQYKFVSQFESLGPLINKTSGIAAMERFNFWLNSFKYQAAIQETECSWGEFNMVLNQFLKSYPDPNTRKPHVLNNLSDSAQTLISNWTNTITLLQQTVYSTGELGTIMNMEQHNRPVVIDASVSGINSMINYIGCYIDSSHRDINGSSFSSGSMTPGLCINYCSNLGFKYAGVQYSSYCFCGDSFGQYGQVPYTQCNMTCPGSPSFECGGTWRNSVFYTQNSLPQNLMVPKTYQGDKPRLIVPTVRTVIGRDENNWRLQAMVLGKTKGQETIVEVNVRKMASKDKWQKFPMQRKVNGRDVWELEIQQVVREDFEWFVVAVVDREELYFPVTAPNTPQTVVVI